MGEMVLSSASHIPQLKTIWLSCFPEDTRETVDLFFEMVYRPEECLVRIEEGIPVSMVFMLPAVWQNGDGLWPVQYIYAAATLPQWQKRGYFGELLQKALVLAKQQGQKASFLRPGEESLFAYYQRFGYKPFFYREYACVQNPQYQQDSIPDDIKAIPFEEFPALRDEVLSAKACRLSSCIHWGERLARYAARSAVLSGGGILRSPKGYAIYETEADSVIVKELVCPEEEKPVYSGYFANHYPGKTLQISMPAKNKEKAQPFGVWLSLNADVTCRVDEAAIPYMGLALD